ncbi:lipid II flippase Amj family protein, partial [Bacillus velezensis]|uniref:lipid II flippase Amj family protein n=1 Tax=Bacillus velezensis TaxID=492670 RepID=UPI0021B57F5D
MQLFKKPFSLNPLNHPPSYITLPSLSYLKPLQFPIIPKPFFLINILITSIYTIPLLSTLYAGLLAPHHTTT